jgi:hypothetical protein
MDFKQQIFSAAEIDRSAGISGTERRTLVRLGVLKPLRTAAGWAVFGEDDMAAARQWALSKRGTKKRGGRGRR